MTIQFLGKLGITHQIIHLSRILRYIVKFLLGPFTKVNPFQVIGKFIRSVEFLEVFQIVLTVPVLRLEQDAVELVVTSITELFGPYGTHPVYGMIEPVLRRRHPLAGLEVLGEKITPFVPFGQLDVGPN